MNIFTYSKKTKKFILTLVVLILFGFCYPKNINADIGDEIVAAPAKIIWYLEKGVLTFLNNIFTTSGYHAWEMEDQSGVKYLRINLTPDNIIKGKFLLLDANIFKEVSGNSNYYDYTPGGAIEQGKLTLRNTIAGWYYALRNLAIVALLSVLVYVGIRMIISTVAQDKAKYKMMFKDWFIALCLLMIMHYLMIGILNISSEITDALGGGDSVNMVKKVTSEIIAVFEDDDFTVEIDGETIGIPEVYAKVVVLAGIIIYTFIFAVKYLKREFTIIFLILLGPVSCITYPIDKISDGKAQAFNRWFSEFLFQVIIQPFHLLLYIVLVGSAIELANANILYALVCFAVMIPAEKFIKEMFGFKDKLGSPLGAFAGGAIAAKAFGALTKGGGSGSSGNKGEDNSIQNTMPPKTVNKDGLVEGNKGEDKNAINAGEDGGGPISQKENPALEAGEEPGGNASVADAYQNSDDPIAEADRAALEEKMADGQINPNDLTDTQNALLAGGTAAAMSETAENNQNVNDETEQDRAQEATEKNRKMQTFMDKAFAIHNERASKKWSSTNRGQRWVNRGKKVLGNTAKFAVRTATTGAGAIAGGALGIMVGKGAAGVLGGAAIGKGLGNKVIKGATGIANGAKDYSHAFRKEEGKGKILKSEERLALDSFKADPKQIDKATLSYKENHQGRVPSSADLDKEMEDRFELSRYNLSEDDINHVLPIYQAKVDELKDGGKSMAEAVTIAGSQAKQTAKLAKFYKPKDLQDPKVMQNAYNNLVNQLKSQTNCTNDVADKYARQYLTDAGRMHGVASSAIALPPRKQTIDIQIPAKQVASSLGVQQSRLNKVQLERMNKVTVKLHQAGFSEAEIKQIASNSKGGTVTEVIDKYEAQVEYLNDSNAQNEAKMTIEARSNGNNATKEQIDAEMRERLILKSTFDVKNEGELSAMRDLEQKEIRGKSQIQAAREFANQHRGQLNNEAHMIGAKQELIKMLMKDGSSSSKATKDAENIISLAAEYNNEIITWDNNN